MSADGQFPSFLLGSKYALQVCTRFELVKLVCGPGRTGEMNPVFFFSVIVQTFKQ
jgi:hypothetical protein